MIDCFVYETLFDWEGRRRNAAAIEERMASSDFWTNPEKAQETVSELRGINSILKPLEEALHVSSDVEALAQLASEDSSIESELSSETDRLEKLVDALELASLLSGPHDASNAIVSINARDGGTDANDWAEMLMRMYSLWASKHEYSVELLDRQDDAVAGIQSAPSPFVDRGRMAT